MSHNDKKHLSSADIQKRRNEIMKRKLASKRKDVADDFLERVTGLPVEKRPGNVGDINNVIWGSIMSFSRVELAPNTTMQTSFIVNAEAAFTIIGLTKTVFTKTGAGPFTYTAIDVNDESFAGNIDSLYFQIRDAQSGRVFNNGPTPIECIGSGDEPTALVSPWFILPNSTIEIIFSNNHAVNTYVPLISCHGYRSRVQNQNSIMSTATGKVGSGLNF
jgi:hypothetical protein